MSDSLVTLQKCKDYLNIKASTYDNLLSMLIGQASAIVENFCNRTFLLKVYEELYTGDGTYSLMLDNFPVKDVYYLSQDIDKENNVINSLIPPNLFFIQPKPGIVQLFNDIFWMAFGQYQGFYSGVYNALYYMNIYVKYSAGYDVTPADIEAVILNMVSKKYYDISEKRFGVSGKSAMGENITFTANDINPTDKKVLEQYRRIGQIKSSDASRRKWTVQS